MIAIRRSCDNNASLLCIILFLLSLVSGCSHFSAGTESGATDTTMSSGNNLIKRVALIKFENRSFIGQDEFDEIFHKNLFAKFEKACPGISLIKAEETRNNLLSGKLPKTASGQTDSFKIAQAGREAGLNAIITGTLTDISGEEESKGILWFSRSKYLARIEMTINIYDSATGTKTYEDHIKQRIEIEEIEYDALAGKTPRCILEFKEDIMASLLQIGKSVCGEINKQPWQGYIISVKENDITVSSGKNAGLKTGMIFEVYDSGKIISGAGGQRFFMPGKKSGTVRITEVSEDRAEAVVLTGENIRAGSILKGR